MTGTLKARVNGQWVPIGGGGGSGADEVWVGADTPPSADAELWYDTDDEPEAVDQANFWNSAWGVIGRAVGTASTWTGNQVLSAITCSEGASPTLTLPVVAGRRYRAMWRGVCASTAAGDIFVPSFDSPAPPPAENAQTRLPVANGTEVTRVEKIWDQTTAATVTLTAQGRRSTASTGTVSVPVTLQLPSVLTVEDIGPITKAAVNPPAGQPTIAAAGNALGIVAVGATTNLTPQTIPINTVTAWTQPLAVTLHVGRRYRIAACIRALTAGVAAGFSTRLFDGANQWIGDDRYTYVTGPYDSHYVEFIRDGDGAAHSLTMRGGGGGSAFDAYTNDSFFYVEDLGPNTSPALPIPETPPAWTPLVINPTAANGWTQRAGETPLSYRVVGDEVVVRGSVNVWTGINAGNVLTTLPPGARPLYPVQAASTMEVPTVPSWFPVRIGVRTNGEITVNGMTSSQGFIGINLRFSVSP